MASRRSLAAAAATAGLAAGALALTPMTAQAATITTPGSVRVWGATTGSYPVTPDTSGYTAVTAGQGTSTSPATVLAIDNSGALKVLAGSDAPADPTFGGQQVTAISATGTSQAAALTADGTLHSWGNGRPTVVSDLDVPLSAWTGLKAGAKPVQISMGSLIVLVRFSDGEVGEVSSFGNSLLTTDGDPASPRITGVTDIAANASTGSVVLSDGTVDSVDSAGNPTSLGLGSASDPIVDIADGGAVAVSESGTVYDTDNINNSTGEWQAATYFPADQVSSGDKVVQVAALTGGVFAARTADGHVIAWNSTSPSVSDADAVPDDIQGKVIDLEGEGSGGGSLQAIVAAEPLDTPVALGDKPTISGTAQAGQTLTGTPATYTGTPDSITNVWKDDTGATLGTGTTLALTNAMVGHTITFETTLTKAGQDDIVSDSAASGPVAKAPAAKAAPSKVAVSAAAGSYGHATTATVKVTSTGAVSGTVAVKVDGAAAGTATLAGGAAKVTLPATLAAGSHTVTATYVGNATSAAANGSAKVSVAKATSTTKVKLNKKAKKKAKKGKKLKVKVVVTTSGGVATGTVKVKVGKAKKIATVVNGKATVKVKLKKKGKQKVKVTYAGNANIGGSKAKAKLKVK